MSQFSCLLLLIISFLFLFQQFPVECNPLSQKIIIHGHHWTVPNEPGWEQGKIYCTWKQYQNLYYFQFLVVKEAEPIRHRLLSNCLTSRSCRSAVEELRQIFLKFPVSSKYYDVSVRNDRSKYDPIPIFKWG